ncbi:MAG: tetratricopeptide repeat protein [Gammaproteobacteria bacterium]
MQVKLNLSNVLRVVRSPYALLAFGLIVAALVVLELEFTALIRYAKNPLILIAFGLLIFLMLSKALIGSGLLSQVGKTQTAKLVSRMLTYLFVIVLILIVAGVTVEYIHSRALAGNRSVSDIAANVVQELIRKRVLGVPVSRADKESIHRVVGLFDYQAQSGDAKASTGLVALENGDPSVAKAVLEEKLSESQVAADRNLARASMYANALGDLESIKNLGKAESYYRKAVSLNNLNYQARYSLGRTLWEMGDLKGAERQYLLLIGAAEENHQVLITSNAQGSLALVYALQGEKDKSTEAQCEATRALYKLGKERGIVEKTGVTFDSDNCTLHFPKTRQNKTRKKSNKDYVEAIRRAEKNNGSKGGLIDALSDYVDYLIEHNDLASAEKYALKGRSFVLKQDDASRARRVYWQLTQIAAQNGRYSLAKSYVLAEIEFTKKRSAKYDEAYALLDAAWLQHSFCQLESARDIALRARKMFQRMNDTYGVKQADWALYDIRKEQRC